MDTAIAMPLVQKSKKNLFLVIEWILFSEAAFFQKKFVVFN